MSSLEDAIGNIEERERMQSGTAEDEEEEEEGDRDESRIPIGRVEHFFDKIGVAAIELTGSLRVGDTIEIESDEEVLRQKVSSMQIDRRDVNEASKGDSIGIKTDRPVSRGSSVYRLQ